MLLDTKRHMQKLTIAVRSCISRERSKNEGAMKSCMSETQPMHHLIKFNIQIEFIGRSWHRGMIHSIIPLPYETLLLYIKRAGKACVLLIFDTYIVQLGSCLRFNYFTIVLFRVTNIELFAARFGNNSLSLTFRAQIEVRG